MSRSHVFSTLLILLIVPVIGSAPMVDLDPSYDEPEPPKTKDEYFDLHANVMNADSTIKRVIRSKPRLERRPSIAREAAEAIIEHGKVTRGTTVYSDTPERTVKKWLEYTDGMLKGATDLAQATQDESVDADAAQQAYKSMTNSCNACHKIFREEQW